MNKLDIVITMAGLGSRFRKAGYTVPKYMIEVKSRTLFEWSMLSLSAFTELAARFIFIVMKDKKEDETLFIESQCKKLNITKYNIICIDFLTDGQAATAMLGSKYWQSDHGLLIYNIDTYVEAGCMQPSDFKGDGFIPCFIAPGDHWSFAKADKNYRVSEVREKERISDYCTLGAYYFKSCQLYENIYNQYYSHENNLEKGEKYVAPLYNALIQNGYSVYLNIIDYSNVHVLGTPEEVMDFAVLGE